MAKQSKPKVSELVEVLIQQMNEFEKAMNERNQVLTDSISKLKYLKVDFNVEELEAMKQSNRELLKIDFEEFHAQTTKNNEKLLKVHKKVSSNKLIYFLIVNIFFLSIAGLSYYVAVKNSVEKTDYESIVKERDELKMKALRYDNYFSENQKEAEKFKKWLKN